MTSLVLNSRPLRDSLGRFATGVTVITAVENGTTHGMTANAFVSVSLDPPLVLVSLDNRSQMHRILPTAGRYGVSVLAEDQKALSDHFAGRGTGDAEIRFIRRAGTALLEGALAHFVVKVMNVYPTGDHTLYVGLVEDFQFRDENPLIFMLASISDCLPKESDRKVRCSPSFGPKFSLIKVDRCLQNIIDRSLLLGLWEL